MTYPCNHRGGLSHSKIKYLQRLKKKEMKQEGIKYRTYFYDDGKEWSAICIKCFHLIVKIVTDWPIYSDFL